jgi:GT2 family glycosyltransferase
MHLPDKKKTIPASGITVVVPTLNRSDYLLNTVQMLLKQEYEPMEILVIDQSSVPDKAMLKLSSEQSAVLSYHSVSFRGLPPARNYGWQTARYDTVVYIDDDIECGPSFVSGHARALFEHPGCIIAGAIFERNNPDTSSDKMGQFNFWSATPVRRFAGSKSCKVDHVPGGNFSVNRAIIKRTGGFDERLNVGAALYEETEFCLRARRLGIECFYTPDAGLTHLAASSGGCRQDEMPKYIHSLAHNRTMLIYRYCQPVQRVWAVLVLFRLTMAYSSAYRLPLLFIAAFRGVVDGARDAKRETLCTKIEYSKT